MRPVSSGMALAAIFLVALATAARADKAPFDPKGAVYATDLQNGTQIVGLLGAPLGELTSVRARFVNSKSKETPVLVEVVDVNGKALPAPIQMNYTIWQWGNLVNNALPRNEDVHLRVYETGGMVGVPIDAMKETTYVQTVSWGFRTSLVLLYEEK